MLNLLVLFVHPHLQHSRVNKGLRKAISGLPGIDIHDLYGEYPDFYVDIKREQAKLLANDIVVFQHPLYWYSAPALLQEWHETVIERGWAHGRGAAALHGKYWLQAVTMAGTHESYSPQGQNRFSMTEILRPFEATAHACKMIWLPPFLTYGTSSMDEAAIAAQASNYRQHLTTIQNGEF
uniref:Glutathione-regulated potassium-efflux system ancillary protein KefG n=1 Tax=Candidatus Kentrum sp. FM TaxID=2126340 RepID=A0A450U0C0_9GAMM|nr:MAG: glutathione-regulated potassium-efflux system ancillary protein KefG [Candidatus Kentron sp. FM]VFJ75766.1 MAG: glutathione-regulated potassium-efflux system ancillary protein KefG [Candidatus Kentron sp. FM]VFK14716.1 MAG: glutathione-regulated potassium-efflux system ancillary protein KefG [Candidatus Kentron sp. FM]